MAIDFREGLSLNSLLPIRVSNGGLFISRGQGIHPDRVIDSHELIFVKDGVLSIEEEQRAFEVHEGEALLLWPHRRHKGVALYPPNLTFYWLHFHVTESAEAAPDGFTVPQHVKLARPDHLTSLFRRFLDDQETLGVEPLPASLLAMLMLYEVASSGAPQNAAEKAAARLAGRADALIRTHFHEPLSTSSIARSLHCNPDYLGRVFQSAYGCTLTDAIHQRRLKFASRLLLESDETVEEVAKRCGFHEANYFRRLFKRKEGITPRAFRQLYAKLHVNTE